MYLTVGEHYKADILHTFGIFEKTTSVRLTKMRTFACVFLVVCVAGLSNGMDLSAKLANLRAKNLETLATIRNKTEGAMLQLGEGLKLIEENVHVFFKKIGDTQNVCSRNGTVVNCCANDLLKNTLCLGLNVNSANFSVEVTFSVNGRKFIDESVSGQNPPPICGALPQLPILQFCVEPYGLGYSNDTLTVCAAVAARIVSKDIARVNLSCLQLNKDGSIKPVKPTSSAKGSAIININTSKFNPLLNQTFNPVHKLTNLVKG
ncbi:hypothetical protein GE061_000495 [Apolygus lucorum]|uniref:DUF4773 domain-containing protein n=1 Tax=Apolygus lucorum TaxID=248454 RepID=A0A8S9Y761_APOLU|nr:hypothetical protein GE061_000495 [Apolygus lucorum]